MSTKLYIDSVVAWLLFTGFQFWQSNVMHILFHVQRLTLIVFGQLFPDTVLSVDFNLFSTFLIKKYLE